MGWNMKIYSIGARNFRTLEDFSIDLKSNYCAISGKNNSGKSGVIDIIQFFLNESNDYNYFYGGARNLSLIRDKTQWSAEKDMELTIDILIDKINDSEIFYVIETFSKIDMSGSENIVVRLSELFVEGGPAKKSCVVDNKELDHQATEQIFKKIKTSSSLVVHNSTNSMRNLFNLNNSYTEIIEAHFSDEDKKRIAAAQSSLQSSLKKAAKQHREQLEGLLGKMSERYHVEFSALPAGQSARHPLQIKLTDKSADVPLNDWGSGTQNRTKILLSLLDAVRMKGSTSESGTCTPVLLIEEPESFLHPSAQAEFGRILNDLAGELGVQIITTTHSPYMLNQNDPSANYLLDRKAVRGKPRAAYLVETSGPNWMAPFAENLGVIPDEFQNWKALFGINSSRVVLVEGDLDKEYFGEVIRQFPMVCSDLNGVEIVPYNGRTSLKNTALLKFIVSRFGKVFITYDLDANAELKPILEKIGLQLNQNFCPVGTVGPGLDCIEGLVPQRIKAEVYGSNSDLVTALGSSDRNAQKDAKSALKRKLLDKFKNEKLSAADAAPFLKLIGTISKAIR